MLPRACMRKVIQSSPRKTGCLVILGRCRSTASTALAAWNTDAREHTQGGLCILWRFGCLCNIKEAAFQAFGCCLDAGVLLFEHFRSCQKAYIASQAAAIIPFEPMLRTQSESGG